MLRLTADSKQQNNAGFSLVELIIVVSILAIAAVPLMKSMGMATKANSKAQSLQNATSLAEKIMEEMKSSSISVLKTDPAWNFTDNGTNYVLTSKNPVTATQGEEFNVAVTIDTDSYKTGDDDIATKADNVADANRLKLPRIEDIDTMSQAVLSSAKEFNRYDKEALNYFNQKIADYPTHVATISSKTVDIIKTSFTGLHPGVTVKATVTYTDASSNKYVRELYTGTFVQEERSDGTKKPLDSNIYIFYTVGNLLPERPDIGNIRETINIKDTSNPSAITDPTVPMASHKVFFIRQDKNDSNGPLAVKFNDTYSFTYLHVDALEADGHQDYGNIRFITNLDNSNITKEGHLYGEEARIRVYDITVVLTKPGEPGKEYARLESTISADDPTPTPVSPP